MPQPLRGIRVLSMEQAAALPFATRHLLDLGAEVIRVQAPGRGPAQGELGLLRGKRMVGLDLSKPGGPALFRRIAAECDVVAHNFTPRVVRKYGIDFAEIAKVNPRVIYCDLTGFGSSGPWSERPLFGPGAEAVSGHNLLIGEPGAATPGRPGTITYADFVCGSYLTFAILAALHDRKRGTLREARQIDICLYETAVAHLGHVLAERSLDGNKPERVGNHDSRFAVHGVFRAQGEERYVALAVRHDQLTVLMNALGIEKTAQLRHLIESSDSGELALRLQQAGIAAECVSDAADVSASETLWQRGYFGQLAGDTAALPLFGPLWGGGAWIDMAGGESVGASNQAVLRDVAGLEPSEISSLAEHGVIGEAPFSYVQQRHPQPEVDIDRGFLSRVDDDFDQWRATARATSAHRDDAYPWREGDARPLPDRPPQVLELPGCIASQYAARLLAEVGWPVVKVMGELDHVGQTNASRYGGGVGAAFAYLNRSKVGVPHLVRKTGDLTPWLQQADIVVGDLRSRTLAALGVDAAQVERSTAHVIASVSPYGENSGKCDWVTTDLTLQAASGLLRLTGEFDQAPQQLPPEAAHLIAGVAAACAIVAASLQSLAHASTHTADARNNPGGRRQRLDLAAVEAMTALGHAQVSRYLATGEVSRREGRVKQALRMVPTRDGFVYCAPGAVATATMDGVAELLGDLRLADPRFATAAGRMQHWDEYVRLMFSGFAQKDARHWFEGAQALHLTFAYVQTMDDLLRCEQLRARSYLLTVPHADRQLIMPRQPYRTSDRPLSPQPFAMLAAGKNPWPQFPTERSS